MHNIKTSRRVLPVLHQLSPPPMMMMITIPLLLLSLVASSAKGEFHCQTDVEWWNGTCVACTKCAEVVLRTCQPHKDTICGSYKDIKINVIQATQEKIEELDDRMASSWEWTEILLIVAAVTSFLFVLAALYLIRVHKQQFDKMQKMDEEMEQDISRLIGKLSEVPNIQKTTAILVDEHQIKKQAVNSGSPFRWIYLDQLLGKPQRKAPKCGNVYTDRNNHR